MITRQDYRNGKASHQDYYNQFATPSIKKMVSSMKNRIIESKDEHFNDIPLDIWDHISTMAFPALWKINFKINGSRSASLSDGVCAAKAYARTLKS